jgi:chromosomal replication initiation ATPase DnaA
MIAMYLAVHTMKEPVTGVADWFEKTHSSVNYSINKIDSLIKNDNQRIIRQLDRLKDQYNTSTADHVAINA